MNSILLFESDRIENDLYKITDDYRLSHMRDHLKASLGDELKVTLIDKGVSLGVVEKLNEDQAILNINLSLLSEKEVQPYSLMIGASRPPTIKKLLEHGTSLGVQRFQFFCAELSEKSYLTSKVFEKKNIERHLRDGLSQSAIYSSMPEVELHPKRQDLSAFRSEQKFLLSFNTDHTFEDVNLDFSKQITLAIGPERGWTSKEEAALVNEAWMPIRLCPSILRVEIATFAALGQLEMLRFKNRT